MRRPAPIVLALPAVFLLGFLVMGCGLGDVPVGPPSSTAEPVTVVMVDVSGSTRGRRDAYVVDAMAALTATAELDGSVYVGTVDGLAADEAWPIAGRTFSTSIGGGNEQLAAAARRKNAKRLRPQVQRLLYARGQGGTDLLAGLTNVQRLLCALPGSDRRLVLITDGAVVAGGVDLYRRPPLAARARADLVSRLLRDSELPRDLACGGPPVRVWLSQLGAGVRKRATAISVRRFFVAAVQATGALVVAEEPQLLISSFLRPPEPLASPHVDDDDGG